MLVLGRQDGMGKKLQGFLDENLWLLIGIPTFTLVSLMGIGGMSALAGAIAIIGRFLLTPAFFFWGKEIALEIVGETEAESLIPESEDDALGRGTAASLRQWRK